MSRASSSMSHAPNLSQPCNLAALRAHGRFLATMALAGFGGFAPQPQKTYSYDETHPDLRHPGTLRPRRRRAAGRGAARRAARARAYGRCRYLAVRVAAA